MLFDNYEISANMIGKPDKGSTFTATPSSSGDMISSHAKYIGSENSHHGAR